LKEISKKRLGLGAEEKLYPNTGRGDGKSCNVWELYDGWEERGWEKGGENPKKKKNKRVELSDENRRI